MMDLLDELNGKYTKVCQQELAQFMSIPPHKNHNELIVIAEITANRQLASLYGQSQKCSTTEFLPE